MRNHAYSVTIVLAGDDETLPSEEAMAALVFSQMSGDLCEDSDTGLHCVQVQVESTEPADGLYADDYAVAGSRQYVLPDLSLVVTLADEGAVFDLFDTDHDEHIATEAMTADEWVEWMFTGPRRPNDWLWDRLPPALRDLLDPGGAV